MFKKSLNYNESLNVVDVIVKRVFMIILWEKNAEKLEGNMFQKYNSNFGSQGFSDLLYRGALLEYKFHGGSAEYMIMTNPKTQRQATIKT